jgi:hypothetical protein
MKKFIKRIRFFVKTIDVRISLWRYFRTRTVKDLEWDLVKIGCGRRVVGDKRYFTMPDGKATILITDSEIVVNP